MRFSELSLLSFCFASFVIVSGSFLFDSLSSVVFGIFILLVGNFFGYITNNNDMRNKAISAFNIIFIFYILLAFIHYLGYLDDWSSFTVDTKDEYKFYIMADTNKYYTISEIFVKCFLDRAYLEYGLYVFYISSLASISYNYIDGHNLLVQQLGTVLFGSMTTLVVYKMLAVYVNSIKSFKYTLTFMALSLFSYYSFVLLRDIPIAFFFAFGVYIVLKKKNNKFLDLILLFITNWIVWELRSEHGFIFTLLVLYYCYKNFKSNKILLLTLGLTGVFVFSLITLSYKERALQSFDKYDDFTSESVNANQDSIGKILYGLPPGIKQISIVAVSQIQPFPSWGPLLESKNIYNVFLGSLQIICQIFWFLIYFSILKWILLDRKNKFIRNEILIVLLICIVFFLINSINMTLRRIIGMYPFIYLLYVVTKETAVSAKENSITKLYALLCYIALIIFYSFLKI